VEGSCGHGNEPSGSIKCLEFLEWLSYCWLLTKDSAPWSLSLDFQGCNLMQDFSFQKGGRILKLF
jgi:hypothetical protein